MESPFDPAQLTLGEITKVQERVTAILGAPTTLDQAVSFIKNNADLVPAILGAPARSEATTTVEAEVTATPEVKKSDAYVKVDIYPVKSKTGDQLTWAHLPWDQWTNGEVWELRFSSQMTPSDLRKFRFRCAKEAMTRGLSFSGVLKSKYSKYMLIQFTPKKK